MSSTSLAIERENATVSGSPFGRWYTAKGRLVGGDVAKITPSKLSEMIDAGTRVGPSPAAASSGALAVCSARRATLGLKPAFVQASSSSSPSP